ncbi:MAG: DNA-directed RNA polymerase subunit L [archaeon]|nr:DNA-directed RNA polymerase subunit L [archaeon]
MQIQVLKNEANFLEFMLKGERHTLPNLLKAKLLEDSAVIFCAYSLEHPFDLDSKFVVRTSGKTAKKALTEACTELIKDLGDFNTEIKKALK